MMALGLMPSSTRSVPKVNFHLSAHRRESRETPSLPSMACPLHAVSRNGPRHPVIYQPLADHGAAGSARRILLRQHQHYRRRCIRLPVCPLLCQHDRHPREMLRAVPAHPCARRDPLSGLHVCSLPGLADIVEYMWATAALYMLPCSCASPRSCSRTTSSRLRNVASKRSPAVSPR